MPKNLLLADDSVVIQKLVGLSFANEDVDLTTTDNGDDAIARARALAPDLVLADVVMPGKNGYEVCAEIKRDPSLRHIPVLLLTGTFEAFDEDRAREVGSNGHITKPFEAQALVDRVNELLASAPSRTAGAVGSATGAADPATPASSSGDDAYDFFDDNLDDLSPPEPAAAQASPPEPPRELGMSASDSSFAFGTDDGPDLAPPEPRAPAAEPLAPMQPIRPQAPPPALPEQDRTIALIPDEPADRAARENPAETRLTTDFDAPAPAPAAPSLGSPDSFPEMPPAPSFGAESVDPVAGTLPPQEAAPPAAAPTSHDPAETVLADDLFGEEPTLPPAVHAAGGEDPDAATSDPLEFSFADSSPTPELARPSRPAPQPEAVVEPEGVSAFDISSSDLGDPLGTPAPPDLPAAPENPTRPEGLESEEVASKALPDLSPMMRDRIHETLEKVAWEAFSELSDQVVRQVLARVEAIAWEVIPQMAEAMVREEIRRMKGEDE